MLEDNVRSKKYILGTDLKTILKCSECKINSCLTNSSFWSLLIKLQSHFQLITDFNLLLKCNITLEMKLVLLPHKPLDRISITLISHQFKHFTGGSCPAIVHRDQRASSKSFPFKCLNACANSILVHADSMQTATLKWWHRGSKIVNSAWVITYRPLLLLQKITMRPWLGITSVPTHRFPTHASSFSCVSAIYLLCNALSPGFLG